MAMVAAGELIFSLLGTRTAVGVARTLADARLRKWDYFHILDESLLVVSELVINAVQETPNEEIRLQLRRVVDGLLIAVWDSSLSDPHLKPLQELTFDDLDLSEDTFDDNCGWGLHIVQTLAARCGAVRDPGGGKWIWARMGP